MFLRRHLPISITKEVATTFRRLRCGVVEIFHFRCDPGGRRSDTSSWREILSAGESVPLGLWGRNVWLRGAWNHNLRLLHCRPQAWCYLGLHRQVEYRIRLLRLRSASNGQRLFAASFLGVFLLISACMSVLKSRTQIYPFGQTKRLFVAMYF